MNMPKAVIPKGGSIVVTDVDPEGPASSFGIQVKKTKTNTHTLIYKGREGKRVYIDTTKMR
jgi:hypothetical protein